MEVRTRTCCTMRHYNPGVFLAHQSLCCRYRLCVQNTDSADFVQSLGDILVGVSVSKNSLMTGVGCTVQGFLINSGDVASAMWSFVVALHTFILLAGPHKWRTWVARETASGKTRWAVS